MAIFSLTSYSGSAEILGKQKRVCYSNEGLRIDTLSLPEANEILGLLATGKIKAVQPDTSYQTAMNEVLCTSTEENEKPIREKKEPPTDVVEEKLEEPEPEEEVKETKSEPEEPEDKPAPKRGRRRRAKAEPEEKEDKEEKPRKAARRGKVRPPKKQQTMEEEFNETDDPAPKKGNRKKKQEEAKDWVAGHDDPDGGPGHPLEADMSAITDDIVDEICEEDKLPGILRILINKCKIKKPRDGYSYM